ncbi:MAG: hypothetical protein AB7N71_15200 [Phycisphaerae bacterium]
MSYRSVTADDISNKVQDVLDGMQPTGYRLEVKRELVRQDNDWWYVPVMPTVENVRSHEYAILMAKADEVLESQNGVNVLLVPVIPNDNEIVIR